MRQATWFAVLGLAVVALAGCGGGGDESSASSTESDLNEQAQAACTGSALSAEPKLPPSFPQVENVTFTQQKTQGPTDVVEGYFMGSLWTPTTSTRRSSRRRATRSSSTSSRTTTRRSPGRAKAEAARSRYARSAATTTRSTCT